MRKEETSSGISPEPLTLAEEILEEVVEIMSNKPRIEGDAKTKAERSQALEARNKAMNTWAKAKKTADKAKRESEDNLTDDDKPLPKKSRKRRRGSDALNFLQEQGEREEERRLEEFKYRREMAAIETKRQDLLQQQLQMQQQQMQQMQTMMLAIVSKITKTD